MAKQAKKSRMGRPPLAPEKRKRPTMGFRPTAAMRKQIEDAAAMSGLSMTQEVERRLERSFATETRAEEIAAAALQGAYDVFGGKGRYHVFLLIAGAVADAEEYTGVHWLRDLRTFEIAKSAILSVIKDIGPKAPAQSPRSALRLYAAGKPAPSEIGKAVAKRRLDSIIGTDWPMNPAKKPE